MTASNCLCRDTTRTAGPSFEPFNPDLPGSLLVIGSMGTGKTVAKRHLAQSRARVGVDNLVIFDTMTTYSDALYRPSVDLKVSLELVETLGIEALKTVAANQLQQGGRRIFVRGAHHGRGVRSTDDKYGEMLLLTMEAIFEAVLECQKRTSFIVDEFSRLAGVRGWDDVLTAEHCDLVASFMSLEALEHAVGGPRSKFWLANCQNVLMLRTSPAQRSNEYLAQRGVEIDVKQLGDCEGYLCRGGEVAPVKYKWDF